MSRWCTTRLLATLALAGATTLAGCGSSTSTNSTPTGATTPASTVPGTTATPPATTSTTTPSGAGTAPDSSTGPASVSPSGPAAVRLTVTIASGRVSPNDATVTVRRGQQVSVVVTSDRATEVHVHGYNLHIEAVPGTVTRTFTANQAGTFEIETHDPAFTVYELQVD